MKSKMLIACLALLATTACRAQDTTALINTTWTSYAADTSLTYRQITNICDSQFTLAGYPLTTDDTSTAAKDSIREKLDGSPYMEYEVWKDFWAGRCDVATGKLHSFAADAMALLSGGGSQNCAGASALQSAMTTAPLGWQFIGPQNVTATYEGGYGNSLHQHLGRVNQIVVNSANTAEVYAADEWGGLWKTNNANLAPNNTWTCLSDHLPFMAGIGVTNLYVDFGSTPHHLFCEAGMPAPRVLSNAPQTVGIFYSLDDGATFSQMNISAAIPNLLNDPILAMEYWPGNATSGTKYLFITTKYQVYRLDITNPAAVTSATMFNFDPSVSSTIPADGGQRFNGFTDVAFSTADPTIMYLATASNNGQAFSVSAGLYRVGSSTTCSACTLTNIPPAATADYLDGAGSFSNTTFPNAYYQWWVTPKSWQQQTLPYNGVYCQPAATTQSVETAVAGSYFNNITYTISFTITLPPYTEVDAVLKDVNASNIYSADWGAGATPTPSTSYPTNFDVGPGYSYSGTAVPGHYKNNGPTTQTITVTNAAVTATHFVDRLEFGAYELPGYTSGSAAFVLSNVTVMQPFEKYITNLATTVSAPGYLFCLDSGNTSNIEKIQDLGTSFPATTYNNAGNTSFQFSTVNPNILYEFCDQNPSTTLYMNTKLDMSTNTFTEGFDCNTNPLHTDGRSMFLLPNATNTDDMIYMGEDGGIGVGTFNTASWTSLNGTGMNTSLAFDIGSSIHTGMVGVAATDNSVMASSQQNFNQWLFTYEGDGGQVKYGKRYLTRHLEFDGWSSSSGFLYLYVRDINPAETPVIWGVPSTDVYAPPLAKLVTTYNNEYFGAGEGGIDASYNIYDVAATGAGTATDPYVLSFQSLTTDASYKPHEPIQAVAPDMYDPNYLAAYEHTAGWDQGYFAYTTDAAAATPTWTVKDNHNSLPTGTGWQSLNCMVADPRSPASSKRLWAGAAGYVTSAGALRAFQTVDGGTTWTDISYGLPTGPVNALAYDDQSHYLFAGTDQGIYAYNVDGGPNGSSNPWQCYSLNLPNSFITGLDINRCTGKIYASTYGRGAYEAELPPDANIDGTTTADGAQGINDIADIDYIHTSTTWTQDLDEMRTIYVPAGITLTIQNCTVNMGRDKHIRVAAGGKLIVDNATITNECGYFWGGIEVSGNHSESQRITVYQGQVIIKNHSIIENAELGVSNYDVIADPAGLTTTGGIIQATNSTFLDNNVSVNMQPYLDIDYIVPRPDLSYFQECVFDIDGNYKGYDNQTHINPNFAHTFNYHCVLNGVYGVTFRGCRFHNITNLGATGTGIYAMNSGFIVYPYKGDSCRFRNMATGIDAEGSMSYAASVLVDSASFDSLGIGILTVSDPALSATRSHFNLGDGPNTADVLTGNCAENIGIYSKNSTMFIMQDNDFEGNHGSEKNYGTIVENSGGNDVYVYHNTFHNLSYGVLASGNNRTASSIPFTGLRINCNTFSGNSMDIDVEKDASTLSYPQGIAPMQGSLTYSNGNIFTSGGNIVNNGMYLTWYYHGSHPSTTSSSIIFDAASNSGSCVDSLNMANTTPVMHNGGIPTGKNSLTPLHATMRALKGNYNNQIDNGNTTALVNTINTTSNTGAPALYSTIMSYAPYVSETALEAAGTRNIFTYSQYKNMCAANPDVLRDNAFIQFVQTIPNPMTAPDVAQLQSIAATNTARTTLECNMSDTHAQIAALTTDLLISMKTDTTSGYKTLGTNDTAAETGITGAMSYYDTAITVLDSIGELWGQYEIIGNRLASGDLTTAQDTLMSIPIHYRLNAAQDTEYNHYTGLYTVVKNIANDGRTLNQINSTELATLSGIAQGYSWDHGAVTASAILTNHLLPVPNKIICPNVYYAMPNLGNKPANNGNNSINPVAALTNDTANKLLVYPNPARDKVIFSYSIANPGNNMYIELTNVTGTRIAMIDIHDGTGTVEWSTGMAPAGIYLYKLHNDGQVIGIGKITIVR